MKTFPFTLLPASLLSALFIWLLVVQKAAESPDYTQLLAAQFGFFFAALLLLIIIPSLLGKHLSQVVLVQLIFTTLLIVSYGYYFYTIYDMLTCTGKLCSTVIFYGLAAIAASSIARSCFKYNFRKYTPIKNAKLTLLMVLPASLAYGLAVLIALAFD
jgi:hypothetical protein